MKKHILTGVVTLFCAITATSTPKMYVDEKVDNGIQTHIYEISVVDSVVHQTVDSVPQVKVMMNRHNHDIYPAKNLDQIYFTPGDNKINTKLASFSSCKRGTATENTNSLSKFHNDTIATYRHDRENKVLHIKLISLVGDCCGDGWVVNAATQDSTIVLIPTQTGEGVCNCICTFDVEVDLTNIEPRLYHFVVRDDKFSIDLSESMEGIILDLPRGYYNRSSDCKYVDDGFNDIFPQEDGFPPIYPTAPNQDTDIDMTKESHALVKYIFEPENGTAFIVSVNRVFNCCSAQSSEVRVSGDTVFVNSYEIYTSEEMCDCECPYDISTSIENLKPKKYIFIVDGTEFKIDLENDTVLNNTIYDFERGLFVKNSPCKNVVGDEEEFIEEPTPTTPEHIEEGDTLVSYQFDPMAGTGLIISHYRSLNCCSEKGSKTTIDASNITITTTQSGDHWCQCDCMFDITTKVMGLHLNKKYTFNVDGTKFDIEFDGDAPVSGVVTK